MQQRRRAPGGPHLRLLRPGRRGLSCGVRPGATGGQDRAGRPRAAGPGAAALGPDEIGQLRLAVRNGVHLAHHRGSVAKLEGKLLDADGKVRRTSAGDKKALDGGFTLWTGGWELFDLPPGVYTLELVVTDKAGHVITSRSEKVLHGNPMKYPPG